MEIYYPIFYKTTGIFSQIVKKDLKLKFDYSSPKTNGKIIILPQSPEACDIKSQAELYSVLHHEIGHILFRTDNRNLKRFVDAYPEHQKLAHMVYQNVENYRVDSLIEKLYPGAFKFLMNVRKRQAEKILKKLEILGEIDEKVKAINSVIYHILAREADETYKKEYAELKPVFDKVLYKSPKATYVVAKQVMCMILEMFKLPKEEKQQFQSQSQVQLQTQANHQKQQIQITLPAFFKQSQKQEEKEEKEGKNKNEQSEQERQEGKEEDEKEGVDSDNEEMQENEENEEDEERIGKEEGEKIEENEKEKELEKLNGAMRDVLERLQEQDKTLEEIKTRETKMDIKEITEEEAEEILEEAEEEAEEQLEELEEKIRRVETAKLDLERGIVGKVVNKNVYIFLGEERQPYKDVLSALKSCFRSIKGKAVMTEDEAGIDIDVDNYIQNKAGNKETQIFIGEELGLGLNIVILVDCSGSMFTGLPGERGIDIAMNTLLTLYDALQGLNNVDFEVYAFSGSMDFDFLTPVKKLSRKEIQTLSEVDYRWQYTHTWRAVYYATNVLLSKKGKRLLIIITDGFPEARGVLYNKTEGWTSTAISQARKKGIYVYTIITSELKVEKIRAIFGPEGTWTKCEMKNMGKILINVVGRQIKRLLYSR